MLFWCDIVKSLLILPLTLSLSLSLSRSGDKMCRERLHVLSPSGVQGATTCAIKGAHFVTNDKLCRGDKMYRNRNSLLYRLISSRENSVHFLQLMQFTILHFLVSCHGHGRMLWEASPTPLCRAGSMIWAPVTYPSTNRALRCLTSVIWQEVVTTYVVVGYTNHTCETIHANRVTINIAWTWPDTQQQIIKTQIIVHVYKRLTAKWAYMIPLQ